MHSNLFRVTVFFLTDVIIFVIGQNGSFLISFTTHYTPPKRTNLQNSDNDYSDDFLLRIRVDPAYFTFILRLVKTVLL